MDMPATLIWSLTLYTCIEKSEAGHAAQRLEYVLSICQTLDSIPSMEKKMSQRCVMYTYQLSKMNVIIMHCIHVLKKFYKKSHCILRIRTIIMCQLKIHLKIMVRAGCGAAQL